MNKNIYLDYNAHTPCDNRVIDSMTEAWRTPGNPHSASHDFGWTKQQQVDDSLKIIADIYDCFEEEILFTSGATEANNLAIYSGVALAKSMNPDADTILTSHLEHKSVLHPLEIAAEKHDLHIMYTDITVDGIIDLQDLHYKLENNSVLWLSCCMTNGIIGTDQPIPEVAQLCQNYDTVLHVDASQSGYLDISCHELDLDYLTLSAHKIYGPSGIGLLYSKHLENPSFIPMICGGGQQNGLRAGTLPVPLIIGFTEAVKILASNKKTEAIRLQELRNYLLVGLRKKLTVNVHGSLEYRHPGNLHIAIKGINSMQLLNNVQPYLAVSLGSACDGLNREYSSLMQEMNISREESEHSFRLCIGRMTTENEIATTIHIITDAATKLL